MKRIPGREIVKNQTLKYPYIDIKPLDPDTVDAAKSQVFRFQWASNNIDELLRRGLVCQNYLDIGSCDGFMAVVVAKKTNVNGIPIFVDAIEAHAQSWSVSEETAKLARDKGMRMQTHNVLFEDYETNDKYDIITAFEILEHTQDPVAFLAKLYDSLRFGGFLFMTVPEEHGRYGKSDTNEWHYWMFTIQSLIAMMDESKWRIHQVFELGDLIHIKVSKVIP